MTDEQYALFREALDAEGWYGIFRTRGGNRRLPVASWTVHETNPDSGLTRLTPAFEVPLSNLPLDLLGRYTLLGVHHPLYQPEEPRPAP